MIKAPEGPPRKDSRLGNVIISEKKDKAISKHQVSQQGAAPITKHNPFSRVFKRINDLGGVEHQFVFLCLWIGGFKALNFSEWV